MPSPDDELDRVMERIEELVGQLEAASPSTDRELARELVSQLLAAHHMGLARLIRLLQQTSDSGPEALRALSADPRVSAMLSLHGLGPTVTEDLVSVRASRDGSALSPPAPASTPAERCELCGEALPTEHSHVFDRRRGTLSCTCRACGPLWAAKDEHLRSVPPISKELTDFRMDEERWRAFDLPIDLAFFSRRPDGRVIAHFPSPSGVVNTPAKPDAWSLVRRDNPILEELDSEVAALLVHRLGKRREHYLVSIDRCFELSGVLQTHWRGLSGGDAARIAIEGFFDGLRDRSSQEALG